MSRLLCATLTGTARERGRRHGELFGAQARESGVLEFYRDLCNREIFAELPAPAGAVLDRLHGLFAARLSPETRERVEAFARAARLPEAALLEGMAMPDVINFLVGLTGRALGAPTLGCTSAAAWDGYTEDGRLLYARNLDFPGNEVYDRFPLVLRHRPDRGVPFVSIGCAGSAADGVTGINEEGLSVALHQHYSAEAGPWPAGRPILDLGARVLQDCRDIDAAVELASSWPTTSGWSLVLTHWKKREAAVIQKTARRTVVRRERGGLLVHTNTYDDPALRATELCRPAFVESSRLRRKRAEHLLEGRRGRVDAKTLAGLLNDRLDLDRGLVRAFGQAIHQPYTVTSVVMDPERGELWVAEGPAPVCEGPFRRVALWEDKPPGDALSPAELLPPERRPAYGRFLAGYTAWTRRRDAERASSELDAAVAADGSDPLYLHLRGLFALKAGDFRKAADSFSAGAELPDIAHRRAAQRLWGARALDRLGRRAEALTLYASVTAERPTAPLFAAAQKGLSRAYTGGRIMPDFLYADAYAY